MWRFDKVPKGFWEIDAHVKAYMQWLADKYNICHMDDWHSVGYEHLWSSRGFTLAEKYGGLFPLLAKVFPNHEWKADVWKKLGKGQAQIVKGIKELFPNVAEIQENYRHPELSFSGTNRAMELDIFVPSLMLAVEYQGEPHFDQHYLGGSPSLLQERDEQKRKACQEAGITLLEIPYWQGYSLESLKNLIIEKRPG